jgi:hypothetical protein
MTPAAAPNTDPSVDKAEIFLRGHGFSCEREPSWIVEGRKPDFFCEGQRPLWVEVKNLSDTEQDRKQAYLWKETQSRAASVRKVGRSIALASRKATNKDVKVAFVLADLLLGELQVDNESWRRAFVVVPSDPIYDRTARLVVEEEAGPVKILSCESRSGRYELPFGLQPRSYEDIVSIALSGTTSNRLPLYDIEESGHPLFALELNPGSTTFEVITLLMVDGEINLRNQARLRACIKDANGQIRNGQSYRDAPSIVLVYQDHLLVPTDVSLVASLYGDLMYEFPRSRTGGGRFVYGHNGAFAPGKQSSVSAVCMIRNDGIPLLIHNRWARIPLPQGLLGGKEIRVNDDGSLEFKSY